MLKLPCTQLTHNWRMCFYCIPAYSIGSQRNFGKWKFLTTNYQETSKIIKAKEVLGDVNGVFRKNTKVYDGVENELMWGGYIKVAYVVIRFRRTRWSTLNNNRKIWRSLKENWWKKVKKSYNKAKRN